MCKRSKGCDDSKACGGPADLSAAKAGWASGGPAVVRARAKFHKMSVFCVFGFFLEKNVFFSVFLHVFSEFGRILLKNAVFCFIIFVNFRFRLRADPARPF